MAGQGGAGALKHLNHVNDNDISTTSFDSLLLQPFFGIDPRPTFVIDTSLHHAGAIIYTNPALRTTPCYRTLSNPPVTSNLNDEYSQFWRWATSEIDKTNRQSAIYDFLSIGWMKAPIEGRYNVIAAYGLPTASQTDDSAARASKVAKPVRFRSYGQVSPAPTSFTTRITRSKAIPGLTDVLPASPFLDFFANHDWASSGLGPVETWSEDLKSSLRILLNDPRPATLMWGPSYITVWNEAYVPAVGLRHPSKYATPFSELFPEVPEFIQLLKQVTQSHESMHSDNASFTLTRNGFNEEAYYSWNLIPIFDAQGVHIGTYNPVFDSTRQQIVEKRMTVLTRVSMSTAGSRSVEEFWSLAFEVLRDNEEDFPFLAIYAAAIGDDTGSNHSSWSGPVNKTYKLVDTLNIPKDHPIAAPYVKLSEESGLAQHFRSAAQQNTIVALHNHDGSMAEKMYQGLEVVSGEVCRSVVMLPIQHIESEGVIGFLVAGINPRRPYDGDTAIFLQILSRMLGASMAAAVLVEEEIRRSKLAAREAANEQQKLEAELQYQTKRAKSLNMRFTEFAAKAPISIFFLDNQGRVVFANDLWRQYTGMAEEKDQEPMGFASVLDMTQVKDVEAIWHKLNVEHQPISYETRMLHAFTLDGTLDANREPPWIVCHAFPEVNPETNEMENIIGCFTDISATKRAELLQQKRTEEAIAARKLQEAFVDITSHELRNPMSVVLMCCEAIITAIGVDATTPLQSKALEDDALASSLEAARTIMHCVTHQRRIVDDILTLSKIDSDLLPVTPVRANILETVKAVISMFMGEFKTAKIAFELCVTDSFKEQRMDLAEVMIDPSRLSQILINLTGNALKFTQTEEIRKICIQIAASDVIPTESSTGVRYVEARNPNAPDITTGADWGGGEPVYLQFAVIDSGRGLTEPEKDILFRRFTQASPRTHVQYGGSGLGLYISRELTEKQGGQIGVSSIAGKGSTFAFYVKARRAKGTPLSEFPPTTAEGQAVTSAIDTVNSTSGRRQSIKAALSQEDYTKIPVLIVEDNLVNRRVLKKQLGRLGFPIYEAGDGVEALEFLEQTKYWKGKEESGKDLAVVCCDWEMPRMNGIECIKRVRQLQEEGVINGHIKVIAVTANARKEQIDTALEAGMDDVVSKPFTTADMVKAIVKWASIEI